MAWNLVPRTDSPPPHRDARWMKRFAAPYWTVNFPRPMMASVITTAPDAIRVDAAFYQKQDLCGLIWDSADSKSHPICAYETGRDYRNCTLSFRWQSSGIKPLDAVHGPTLTIEGRDATGTPRSWYVRLWNYAIGTPEDAIITLNFDSLAGGFLHPAEADPVWAGDIDRMFLSIVPPGFDGTSGDLPAMTSGWAQMSAIVSTGSGSMIRAGDAILPPHGLCVATGYDDIYDQTPQRVLAQIEALGYRGDITHYVGMSHYFALEKSGGAWLTRGTGDVLNPASAAWHVDFATRAKAMGFGMNWSLSYELFDAHCRDDWKQRASDGTPALTGWVPPSALLSPANPAAMGYLQLVARAFVRIAKAAGLPVRFQIGEPWWWVLPDGRPCLYDAATTSALGAASVPIASVQGAKTPAQNAMLDAAGAILAQSTAALVSAVRNEAGLAPGATTATLLLLTYLPGSFDSRAPELRRANCPMGWASPAFDILQTEDYEWVTGRRDGDSARAATEITARLGYPLSTQHYLAGFVLNAAESEQWAAIDAAADAARRRGVASTIIWALPQICRDGYVHFGPEAFDEEEDDVTPIDDVLFPLDIGREAMVTTSFSTEVAESPSGHEQRISSWANARMAYDAGPGIRSEIDIAALISFYRDRRGPARGFRFRDPFDGSSAGGQTSPGFNDVTLGIGNGSRTRFALIRPYGLMPEAQIRRITRPVPGSVRIAINGAEQATGWSLGAMGQIDFATPPPEGTVITAGFRFDVPVRFASDQLEISRATFAAGEIASVPLIEIREG
jgi:uncharacterized protein (TIGR02217 family)